MAVYPSNPVPRYGSSIGKRLPAIRTESEALYGRTRKLTTRARTPIELIYPDITHTEYQTLEDFFINNQGTIFDFSYQGDSTVLQVMFAQDEIIRTDNAYNSCSTTVKLVSI